jgi:hypothetical protein
VGSAVTHEHAAGADATGGDGLVGGGPSKGVLVYVGVGVWWVGVGVGV